MGGVFVNKSATDLSVVASTAAMQTAGLKPEKIDSVVFGHVMTVSMCAPYATGDYGLREILRSHERSISVHDIV